MIRNSAFALVLARTGVLLATTGVAAAAQTAVPGAVPVPAAEAAIVPLEPQGFDYDPENRRDPFVSLVRRGTDTARSTAATRGPGLGGLETSEVTLRGTVQSRDGHVAILAGADNRTYIVRAGDRLLDGTIRAITPDAIVILQQVSDPLSLEKHREVRKTIRQADETR
jgi:Tfp pilus assembly protein PilP